MRAEGRSAYPVAMIPYINMLPYRLLGTPPGCCWHNFVPRASVDALLSGKILAAAVPVGALPGLGGCVEPLGGFGIAARASSMSVLFFSRRPFDQVRATDGMRLTPESATSVRLLRLLLERQTPPSEDARIGAGSDAVGALIIGDQALKALQARRANGGGHGRPSEEYSAFAHVTDLATCWFQRHRRPFVFARWVIRRDAPRAARDILLEWLAQFKAREVALVSMAIPIAARQLGLPETVIADYYRCLGRVLDEDDLAGQALFLRELGRSRIERPEHPAALTAHAALGDRTVSAGGPNTAGIGAIRGRNVGPTI